MGQRIKRRMIVPIGPSQCGISPGGKFTSVGRFFGRATGKVGVNPPVGEFFGESTGTGGTPKLIHFRSTPPPGGFSSRDFWGSFFRVLGTVH